MFMGEKITGTNAFAYFSKKIIWTKGGEKSWKMPASRFRYEDLISQVPLISARIDYGVASLVWQGPLSSVGSGTN